MTLPSVGDVRWPGGVGPSPPVPPSGYTVATAPVSWTAPASMTALVLFGLWLNLPAVAVRFHGVPRGLAYVFFLLLAVPCATHLVRRRQPVLLPRPLWWMLAYFGAMAISGASSERPDEALDRLVAHVAEGLVLYLLVVNAVRGRTALRQALWALLLAGVVMGTLSIGQRLTRSYDNELGGLAQVADSSVSAEGGESHPRLAGPIGEKNRYAQVMLVLLAVATCLALEPDAPRRWRLAAAASSVPIGAGMLLTYSRGALVAAAVVLLGLGWLTGARRRHLVAGALLATAVVAMTAPETFARLAELRGATQLAGSRAQLVDGAVLGRAVENMAAARIAIERPLIGIGPAQARYGITAYGNELRLKRLVGPRRAHNMYLEELAENGVLGFIPFLGLLVSSVRAIGLRRRAADPALAVLAGLAAYLVSAVFLHLSYQRYFFLVLGLAAVAARSRESLAPLEVCPDQPAISSEPAPHRARDGRP
ncbi:MAG TPA: O-antigen ligase family protein [Thermoanaerobaculia bacterium]|nr:O-antigen ligase family protein [Thermoanaerobaculia bacterium]